jgi:thymidylate synthase
VIVFTFSGDTVDELFLETLDCVISSGAVIAPRGIETREIFPAAFELRNPRARLLRVPGRYINPAFAIAEAFWILSGSQDPWIFDYNSKLKQFANDGILRGAYGPRIRSWAGNIDQLERARQALVNDHSTRRAIIQIYDPASVQDGDLDVPCTVTHHFLIRQERLHLFTNMRGQDIWLGLPYDIFYNTLLQEVMAHWVGVGLGSYFYRADSLHIYSHDLRRAHSISLTDVRSNAPMSAIELNWEHRDAEIAAVLKGTLPLGHNLTPLAQALRSYRDWKSGSFTEAINCAKAIGGPIGEALQLWYAHIGSSQHRAGHEP